MGQESWKLSGTMAQREHLSSIFLLIRSLNAGGAERQVTVLAEALHNRGYKVTVGVFYSGGILEAKLHQAGVSVYSLDKKGRWDLVGWFLRYLKAIRDVNPDVVYSFLTMSNIVAIIGRFFIRKPVVWGIRASNVNLENYDWLANLAAWIEKKLSRFAKIIIFNAHASRQHHKALGYCLNNPVIIPNGIDTDMFKPDGASKVAIRNQLGIPQDAFVIGMLARVDPMKDYETYLAAARPLSFRHKDLYFLAAGTGTDKEPWPLLPPRFLRIGVWEDVPQLLNTLDIMVLSSLGEGFPNVVGEAMACGIPTIVTDVGDAAYIVADQGSVVPVQNPEALIQAIESMIHNPPSEKDMRDRILSHFSVSQMVDQTLQTLKEAV
jgi:glycosyltransferase involved in cell wall biosynthesis